MMEEMASFWSYQETMEELRQKLLYTTVELERLKAESSEETRKNKEFIKQLVELVKIAIKERDEARDQLQNLMMPVVTKPNNSGVTESNSLSESPVESLVSSPEFLINNNNVVDSGTMMIDSLVRGKALPQKGKLLQAVLEAGPLLQTVMVAGPLPRWRNPPQLKPFHIPPFTINDAEIAPSPSLPQLCFDIPCASSASHLLDFGSVHNHLDKRQRLL